MYTGKLPATVCGDTRNNLIQTFRKWKGLQYVPKLVHPAIRRSKRDPLLESHVFDLTTAVNTTAAMKKKRTISELEPKGQSIDHEEDMPVKKRRRLVTAPTPGPVTAMPLAVAPSPSPRTSLRSACPDPVGMRWSQNSCALRLCLHCFVCHLVQ